MRYGNQQIDVPHLLAALLEQEGGLTGSILTRAGVNVEALGKKLTGELERLPKVSGAASGIDRIYVTSRLNKLLTSAEDEAAKLKDDYMSVEHVLLAAIDVKDLGVTRERLMQALREVRGIQQVTSANPEVTYEALERYGRDLTTLASAGKLDPVIGRDEEIRRVIQVLGAGGGWASHCQSRRREVVASRSARIVLGFHRRRSDAAFFDVDRHCPVPVGYRCGHLPCPSDGTPGTTPNQRADGLHHNDWHEERSGQWPALVAKHGS